MKVHGLSSNFIESSLLPLMEKCRFGRTFDDGFVSKAKIIDYYGVSDGIK